MSRKDYEEPQADLNQSKKRLPTGSSDMVRTRATARGSVMVPMRSNCLYSTARGLRMTFLTGGDWVSLSAC